MPGAETAHSVAHISSSCMKVQTTEKQTSLPLPLLPQQGNALKECYDKVYFEVFQISSLFLTEESNILFQQ